MIDLILEALPASFLLSMILFIVPLAHTLLKQNWQKYVAKKHPDISIQQALTVLDPECDLNEAPISKREACALVQNAIREMRKENKQLKCQKEKVS